MKTYIEIATPDGRILRLRAFSNHVELGAAYDAGEVHLDDEVIYAGRRCYIDNAHVDETGLGTLCELVVLHDVTINMIRRAWHE